MTQAPMAQAPAQLHALALHLRSNRERILQAWRDCEVQDVEITTAAAISRAQFSDHIPQVLDAYERKLSAQTAHEAQQASTEQRENAAEHGLQRWQQGFALRETMREWGHLQQCLLRELESYALAHRDLADAVMPTARAELATLCSDGACESAARYTSLQQTEAADRVRGLELAMQELQALERQRAESWREAAHDLRGAVSVISNATALVGQEVLPEPIRMRSAELLQRNVTLLRQMLGDLLDLARLEAGREERKVIPFDAAQLLRELCDSLRESAAARNLFLKIEGPKTLLVEGDAMKVRRIVQNLVLNALKATQQGGVEVVWDESHGSARQWTVSIRDTGPGMERSTAVPLQQALKDATLASQALAAGDTHGERPNEEEILESQSSVSSAPAMAGEGIGLSIVKRLCELLDATIELDTAPGRGTTFRINFPRRYAPL